MPLSPDTTWGSFTPRGPWVLDEKVCEEYSAKAQAGRADVHRRAAQMLQSKKFPPLIRMMAAVVRISTAIGLWWLIDRRRGHDRSRQGISRRLRKRFVKLGATYIKLGQIISSGQGLFPKQLVDEFAQLRDRVPPEKTKDIIEVIEEEFSRPLESIFSSFNRTPIAAASIAQVHSATLITGEEVVVKVQRPHIEKRVHSDIAVLRWLSPRLVGRIPVTALANPPALVDVFTETILEELDFRLEADNMIGVARVLATTDQRAIVVPRPYLDLVTKRVLVMEKMNGFAFDDVASMKQAGVDTYKLLRAGLVAFAEGALIHGIFHGDLHAGNLFVDEEGTTALVDFGIVGRFSEVQRRAFLRLLIAGTTGNTRQQLVALVEMGAFPPDTDIDAVIDDLDLEGPVKDPTKMNSEQLSNELSMLTKKLLGYGARAPKELMLFVKNMLFLDGATATLAPELNILDEIHNVYQHFVSTYSTQILNDLGLGAHDLSYNADAVKNSFGIDDEIHVLTYEDIKKRREIIKKRMIDKIDE